MKKLFILLSLALSITGYASITPTKEVVEGYKVYDIKAEYSATKTGQLASNLKATMQKRAQDVTFKNGLPPAELSENPKRFELVEAFKDAPGLMALTGGLKMPRCEGAVIEATSRDNFDGAENTTFFVCLIPYKQGYRMNVYYTFTKVSGGISTKALGRALAQSIAGDSSKGIPRTIAALEDAVKEAGLTPAVIDSYPN